MMATILQQILTHEPSRARTEPAGDTEQLESGLCFDLDCLRDFATSWTGAESPFPPTALMSPVLSEKCHEHDVGEDADSDMHPHDLVASDVCSLLAAQEQNVRSRNPSPLSSQPKQNEEVVLGPMDEYDNLGDRRSHTAFDDDDTYILTAGSSVAVQAGNRDDLYVSTLTDEARYELRPAARQQHDQHQVFALDQDDTGDYDTDVEREQNRLVRKRKARTVNSNHDNREHSDNASKRVAEERLLHTITFRSEQYKSLYQQLARKDLELRMAELAELQGGAYRLRPRRQNKALSDDICPIQLDSQEFPTSLVGHPSARGCVECLHLEERCSAMDNEFDWPCSACAAEGHDCIPVLPPKMKTACGHCLTAAKKHKGLICSYLYEGHHDKPCRFCVLSGAINSCFAHPDISLIQQRINIDPDGKALLNARPELKPIKPQRSCLRCQASCKPCNLNNDATYLNMSCDNCEMQFKTCQPITTDRARWQDHTLVVEDPERVAFASDVTHIPTVIAHQTVAGESESTSEQASYHSLQASPPELQLLTAENQVIDITAESDDERDTLSSRPGNHISHVSANPNNALQLPGHSHSAHQGRQKLQLSLQRNSNGSSANAGKAQSRKIATKRATQPAGSTVCKVFMTKLCHPIVFDYDDFANQDPCDFCNSLAYAILGLEDTKVLAKKLPAGKGWQELRTAPSRQGIKPTKVCSICTMQRADIMGCVEHNVQHIANAGHQDPRVARKKLENGIRSPNDIWCSICYNLAKFTCSSRQVNGTGITQAGQAGCGLRLCEHCAVDLRSHEGKLQQMLFEIRSAKSDKRPFGLRADWALLKQGEVLDQFMRGS